MRGCVATATPCGCPCPAKSCRVRLWLQCFAEFAIALKCGRICNLEDEAVQAILNSRPWPTTVSEYAEMMMPTQPEKLRIKFTQKGDAAKVKYNFFKMGGFTFDFEADAAGDVAHHYLYHV